MDCNSCKERRQQAEPVSYVAYESMKTTLERTIKRLWILAIILILLLAGTNAAWIYYEAQFYDESTTVEQEVDTGNGDAFLVRVGDMHYGESETESNQDNAQP